MGPTKPENLHPVVANKPSKSGTIDKQQRTRKEPPSATIATK